MPAPAHLLVVQPSTDYAARVRAHCPDAVFLASPARAAELAAYPHVVGAGLELEDVDETAARVRAFARERGLRPGGIVCFVCEYLPLTAALAARLDLPFHSEQVMRRTRSKELSNAAWRAAGVPAPAGSRVHSLEELRTFARAHPGPWILKPTDGSGSEWVLKVEKPAALEAAHRRLVRGLGERDGLAEDGVSYLVQQFASGREFGADLYIRDGRVDILRLTEKYLFEEKGLAGLVGAYYVARVEEQTRELLRRTFEAGGRALGIERGIAMVDVILAGETPYLLEMALRPGGDCLPDLCIEALGYDPVRTACRVALGLEPDIQWLAEPRPLAALHLMSARGGTVRRIDCDALLSDPRVLRLIEIYHLPGEEIRVWDGSYDDRIAASCLVHCTDPALLPALCPELSALVRIEFEEDFMSHKGDHKEALDKVKHLLEDDDASLYPGELRALVDQCLEERDTFLRAARTFGTPQYLVDETRLRRQAGRFLGAFRRDGQIVRAHYAFKSNPSLPVVQTLRRAGLHADASSHLELQLALRLGFERVLLSGPAKTDAELRLALEHADRVTVHLDSFAELHRLEALAAKAGTVLGAGIRLNTQGHGLWTKFGIPAARLPHLVREAAACPHVRLEGIQFHLSWNRNAAGYERTLAELGPVLASCPPADGWRFLDIGGGYYPEDDEAVYPWLTPRGKLLSLLGLAPAEGPPPDWDLQYLLHPVEPIEQMAGRIFAAFAEHITAPLGPVELWLEPGRYLCNPGVHLLLQVADVKGEEVAITDGGTNLLGWERIESEHCPLINLSRPARQQQRRRVYGSLCTPHDLWGFACYGEGMEVGDILLLPAQGSYVQTLAQRFIKPVCQTVYLSADGELQQVLPEETFAARYPTLKED